VRIVVTGLLGQYAFGGVTWDYIQYLLGFRDLGHEVWYLEDSGAWPYDPVRQTVTEDCTYNVNYLGAIMAEFGFPDRWIYRNGADGKFHGAGEPAARDLIKNADLLVNVSSAGWLKDYDFGVKHQMFIDGDPMFCQVSLLEPKNADYAARVRAHDSHFTFGLNIGRPGCVAPDVGIRWKKTVQPIALDHWRVQADEGLDRFTTVMNWASYAPIEWQGKKYGQKDMEFDRFKLLPKQTSQRLEMAMGQGVGSRRPTEELRALGWTILEAGDVLPDHRSYHEFLRTSKAEWSIAKHGYVAARTGWFSCRTACYLALGRPAIVQETGWSDTIPAGDGLLTFSTMEEAVAAIDDVNDHYAEHQAAARALAEQFFEAKKVCNDLLAQAGIR
jgi:hypothetical protein